MKKLLPLLSLALAGFAAPQAQAAPTDAAADSIDVRFTVTDEKGQPAEGFYTFVDWFDEDGSYVGGYPSAYIEDVNYITDASGQTVFRIPAGQAFYQWRVRDEDAHYYLLYANATEAQMAKGIDVSYEGMHRVDVTATGQFYRTYYDGYGIQFFNAVFTPKGGENATFGNYSFVISLCDYDENGGSGYVVCPDGYLNILCCPTMADGISNYATRTIQVAGKDTAVHFDMTEAYHVDATTTGWPGEEQPAVYFSDKTNVSRYSIGTDGRLVPGEYIASAYAVTFDEAVPVQHYSVQTFNVTDGPVELNFDMSPAKFHTYTYDVTGAPEGAGFSLAYVDHEAKIDLPNPDTYGYRTMLTDGTHHYSVVQLHDAGLKLYNCFPIEGEVTLAGADTVVPLDLSGLTFTKLDLGLTKLDLGLTNDIFLGYFDGYDYWGGELVAADGRRTSLSLFEQPLGVALAPGTYRLEVVVAPGRLFTTKFTVEEGNHFATIDAALEETTGIGTVGQAGGLAARVTPAGIVVTSPKGAARATVYGLDGRTVLTQDAVDGETIGTAQLPAGTYVLYLRQGSEARVVKFIK